MAENPASRTHLSFSGPALLQQAIEVSFDTNCFETATGEDKETTQGATTTLTLTLTLTSVNTIHCEQKLPVQSRSFHCYEHHGECCSIDIHP